MDISTHKPQRSCFPKVYITLVYALIISNLILPICLCFYYSSDACKGKIIIHFHLSPVASSFVLQMILMGFRPHTRQKCAVPAQVVLPKLVHQLPANSPIIERVLQLNVSIPF